MKHMQMAANLHECWPSLASSDTKNFYPFTQLSMHSHTDLNGFQLHSSLAHSSIFFGLPSQVLQKMRPIANAPPSGQSQHACVPICGLTHKWRCQA